MSHPSRPPRSQFVLVSVVVSVVVATVASFAALGFQVRLMQDDYGHLASARELGPLTYALERYHTWQGTYTVDFLTGIIAPLDTFVVALLPAGIVLALVVSLVWTFWRGGIGGMSALALALLMVYGALAAMPSPQALYWFAASSVYALPLALCAWLMGSIWQGPPRTLNTVWLGVVAFFGAGFSPTYAAFQAGIAGLMLLSIAGWRRERLSAAVSAFTGSLIGLILVVFAPGNAVRQALSPTTGNLWDVLTVTSRLVIEMSLAPDHVVSAVSVGILAAFVMAAGGEKRAELQPRSSRFRRFRFVLVWIALGWLLQLAYTPTLWANVSDTPRLLGRYSLAYGAGLALHVVLLFGWLMLPWLRGRLSRLLGERPSFYGGALTAALLALVVVYLYPFTEAMRHYLLLNAALILVMLLWGCLDEQARRWAVLVGGIALVLMWAGLAAPVYGLGYASGRTQIIATFVWMGAALSWGVIVGRWIDWRPRRLWAVALLVLALVLPLNALRENLLRWPEWATFAREWDARDAFIRQQAAAGEAHIIIAPLSINLAERFFLLTYDADPQAFVNQTASRYYGVTSITLAEDP